MSNVRSYTDEELIKRVESLPTFAGWRKGKYAIMVRSNEDEYDRFDDKCYCFESLLEGQKPKFAKVFPITTNAGSQGLKDFAKYNTLGCAVLKSDVLVYNSHKIGKHKGKYTAYVQNVGFPYFRDNDKDNKAEEIGKEYTNIIGANIHKAGASSTQIGGWSVACLVFPKENDFNSFMEWSEHKAMNVVILNEF